MGRWVMVIGLAVVVVLPMTAEAGCEVQTSSATYANGTNLGGDVCGSTGGRKVELSNTLAGEERTNNVLRTEGQFSYSGNKTADTQVKASAGYVHSLVCIGTDAAATAGTIILYDNTAESGTVVLSWAVQAAAYAQPVVFPLDVLMTTGIYLGFTTTNDIACTVSYR